MTVSERVNQFISEAKHGVPFLPLHERQQFWYEFSARAQNEFNRLLEDRLEKWRESDLRDSLKRT